ncbi:MAG: hypothetical protein QOJ99_126 [Bryobacterales bacterium]|jgi:hypothetical protein|nr:hypothetical protein [Bryobacterales bacterium]
MDVARTGDSVTVSAMLLIARYAASMTWHQMGFAGPRLSCRLALGAYDFINMNNTAGQ